MNEFENIADIISKIMAHRAREMKSKYKKYRLLAMEFEMQHYRRLQDPATSSQESSETHLELITTLRNIAGHATNIARIFLNQLEKT